MEELECSISPMIGRFFVKGILAYLADIGHGKRKKLVFMDSFGEILRLCSIFSYGLEGSFIQILELRRLSI